MCRNICVCNIFLTSVYDRGLKSSFMYISPFLGMFGSEKCVFSHFLSTHAQRVCFLLVQCVTFFIFCRHMFRGQVFARKVCHVSLHLRLIVMDIAEFKTTSDRTLSLFLQVFATRVSTLRVSTCFDIGRVLHLSSVLLHFV